MYQRIVCFKFKDDVGAEAIRRHMSSLAALKDAVPQIRSYSGGLVIKEADGPAYDSVHYLTFASAEDLEIYVRHEAHQWFIAENRALWERVLVLNAPVDEAG